MAIANSQGLSPTALRAKRARDKAAAMTSKRKKRKAENQRIGQEVTQIYTIHQVELFVEHLLLITAQLTIEEKLHNYLLTFKYQNYDVFLLQD